MQTKLQIIKRFLSPLKKSPLVHFRAFVIFINWGINGIIHIFFLQKITYSLEIKNTEMFYKILFLYVCYFVYFYTFEFLMRKYGWTEVMPQFIRDVEGEYIKKYVKLDNNYTEKYGVGKSISIIDKGLDKWGNLVALGIEYCAMLLVSLFFTIYILYTANPIYVIFFLILLFLIFILSNFFNKFALKYRKLRTDSKNLYTKQLVKILMSKNEIFQSNKVNSEIDILDIHMKDNIKYNKMMGTSLYGLFNTPSGIILIFLIITIYYLGSKVLLGEITLSTLVGVIGSIIIIQKSIYLFLGFYKDFTKEFVIIQNLWDYFDNTPEIVGYETGDEFKYKNGNFEIKDLAYGYNETKNIFENFSLNINGGKIFAVVGNSGGGKTTLIKLLSGYIRQDNGKIIVDGQDLSKVSLKSYYKNIGYLTQEPSVFDGTILDNLMYGVDSSLGTPIPNPSPFEEEGDEKNLPSPGRGGIEGRVLDQIIKLSKCEFIYDFKDGLNTEIGERGVRLSGGQKQRLAIAKIMLKNPKIILLDEPTSALDSVSEEQITKALNNLFAGRTVIIVAHRLQTVKNADEIILLENGFVKERGKHEELIAQKGDYFKMVELQSGF